MRRPIPFLLPIPAAAWMLLFAAAPAPAQQPVPTATPPRPPLSPFAASAFPEAAVPPGAPAATSAAVAMAADAAADAEIIRKGQGSLVFVEGREGSGSGFICDWGGQKFFVTNAHVMAGNTPVTLTLLDGSVVQVGGAAAAIGHDMVRFTVAPTQAALGLLDKVGENLLVGDDVLVLGNAKGAGVINPIAGKVVGLGPNLVEVDAPFQPGNSGSPIIQKKTGKVVGIATYLTEEQNQYDNPPAPTPTPVPQGAGANGNPNGYPNGFPNRYPNGYPNPNGNPNATGSPNGYPNGYPNANRYPNGYPPGQTAPTPTPAPTKKVRRFGYRLDSVKGWQAVAWPEFQAEAAMLKNVERLTDDILSLIKDIHDHSGYISPGLSHTPALQRLLQDFFDVVDHRPSPSDSLQAKQRLLDSLRRLSQADLTEIQPRLRYDYFQREATERKRLRDELSKSFAEGVKAQTNTTGR